MPKVKLCGLSREEDVKYASELGYDYLGFVVGIPTSPRNITKDDLDNLLKKSTASAKAVAVTVNMPFEDIYTLAKLPIDIIQLHGNETIEYITELESAGIKQEIWKALTIKSNCDLAEFANLDQEIEKYSSHVSKILLDFKPDILAFQNIYRLQDLIKHNDEIILAGGLNRENIKAILQKFQPSNIDLSSGVEVSPGMKSRELYREFIDYMQQIYNHL